MVELEGPQRVTPNEIAGHFREALRSSGAHGSRAARILGGSLQVAGHEEPAPRMQMLDGFNEGWIEFETGKQARRKEALPWRAF